MSCKERYGYGKECFNRLGKVGIGVDRCGYVWIYLDKFGYVWIGQDRFRNEITTPKRLSF